MSQVNIIPGRNFLFWSNSMTSLNSCLRMSEWRWLISTTKEKATKHFLKISNCKKHEKSKINWTVEIKARSVRPRKCSDKMARDLVRNAQKRKTAAKKNCRHRSSCAQENNPMYFMELPERSFYYDLNTKWSVYAKENIDMGQCALDWWNQNLSFWPPPKKVSFREKRVKPL